MILEEVDNLHKIITLKELRRTENVKFDALDTKTNFNVYDLDTTTGESRVIREGHLDQAM